ncbi:ankyrin repeat protein, putative [Trichomonas vaginalis G3]|uniref:Ankyrin repeat protein, putative n=1 Tax=Trichomonas vaginalis (strain ATCC PRA-98 / G3) TaxID=412133 RepID=A2ETD6_TRIV3|nr:Ankyrin repeat family [Trichomonas vaginalis G3]EAY04056.1 ankyrin repeat protein, putative [Trichomonas vaginalis G3]KAI5544838.1 Ankyrin repeat family [Trichomonas vaginalis G3]|eukprot:XP_001316279.1 ankyrin repeat protein [Trichomonas vaginalis G3]
MSGSEETVEVLISHGANINEKNDDGKTALRCAMYYNKKETAEVLILHGAKE